MDRAVLEAFENLLRERIGLNPNSMGSSTLVRVLKRLEQERGVALRQLLVLCRESPVEFAELVKRVVVPESWFFRDRKVFEELSAFAFKHCIKSGRAIRILSAPCAHGEEPYSVAITLLSAGLRPDQIQIIGLDISDAVIEKARAGVFGTRAFRSEILPEEQRFFTELHDERTVRPEVRELVTFYQHNLVNPIPEALGTFDVVLCRNVLIYLTPVVQHQVLCQLIRVLSPTGILVLTPAESALLKDSRLCLTAGGRGDIFEWEPPPAPVTKGLSKPLPISPAHQRDDASSRATPLQSSSRAAQPHGDAGGAQIESARILANEGRISEAVEAILNHVRANPYDVEGQLLLGVLQDARGEFALAREQYRRVLYLEPDHLEALSHLALLELRLGNTQQAERLSERAKRLAQSQEKTHE